MLHFFALSKPPERGCQSFCSHQALSHSEPCAVQPHMQNTLPGHLHCALPSVQLQSRLHLRWVTSLINPTARTKHSHPSATLLVTTGGIYPARKAGREKEGKLHLIYPTAAMSWKREKDIHGHSISPANSVEAFPAAKICAGQGGRLPGHSHLLSCKCAELLKGLPSNSRIFSRV